MSHGTAFAHVGFDRTFLARALPAEISGAVPQRIVDVYLPSNPAALPRLRLRQVDDCSELTWKVPAVPMDAAFRREETVSLRLAEVAALQKGSQRKIEKDRYVVTIDGREAEVDVFGGILQGLVLVKFEFGSLKEVWSFEPPACCGADVTHETFIVGGLLAGLGYDDIASDLDHFHYERIDGRAGARVLGSFG